MTVGFVTRDFTPDLIPPLPGGCAYYRCFLPMQTLPVETRLGYPAWTGEAGFGVMVKKDRAQFGFDTVVLKQLMERQLPAQMRIAQGLGQTIVVDVDDHYDGLPESNMAFQATSAERSKTSNREHYRDVILAADLVTVTTPFLLDYYSKLHPNVRMVRNGVLPEQFTPRKVRDRKPVIGWVGGVPWRGGDLETMREWLPDFLAENDLMFHHSGHTDHAQSMTDLAGVPPERLTTSSLQTIDHYHEMFSFDIGLVPLNDIPFNHAKSSLKGLEYSCAGIPFVAQALPEYDLLASQGVGRVATTPEDWVRELTALLDFSTRKKEARVNRERVVKDHSIMAREQDWRDVLTPGAGDGCLPVR